MRTSGVTLLLLAVAAAPSCVLGKSTAVDQAQASAMDGSGPPSWAGDASPRPDADLGFAPLSVTRDGVVYSTAPPAVDPAASEEPKIADLPAWATSRFSVEPDRPQGRTGPSDTFGFGALPEPAAWALILVGTAMICGALRGLIMAHRRLDRLSAEDEAPD